MTDTIDQLIGNDTDQDREDQEREDNLENMAQSELDSIAERY